MYLGFHPSIHSVPSPRLSKVVAIPRYPRAVSRMPASSMMGTKVSVGYFHAMLSSLSGHLVSFVLAAGDLASVRAMSYTQVKGI